MNVKELESLDEALNYLNEASISGLEKYFNFDDDSKGKKYFETFKKNKSWMEKILNKCSEEAFKTFRTYIEKSYNDDSSYSKYYLEKLDSFYKINKTAPKIVKYDLNTDYIEFCYNTKGDNDMCLFYQDHVMKYITKNEELKSRGYSFSSEDYIGIYIHIK